MEQLDIILKRLDDIEEMLKNNNSIMNIDEVCRYTGISKSTMYKLTSTNQIPHYKKVKQLMFDKNDILEWIKEGRVITQHEIEAKSS